jgi:hypothetical protein
MFEISKQLSESTYFDLGGHHTYAEQFGMFVYSAEIAEVRWVLFGNGSVVPFHFSYWNCGSGDTPPGLHLAR